MSHIPRLLGMIHLAPLPGSPRFDGSMASVLSSARADAETLAEAGFPGLIVENFGDVPFHGDRVEAETVAAMTLAVEAVKEATGLVIGVNVLRNDALAALGIAAATGASMIRVNVLTGVMYTDQGPITGPGAVLMRRRAALAPWVEVWADVMVKHSTPPPGLDLVRAADDTVRRGLADALIVSGPGTGTAPVTDDIALVRTTVPQGTRIVVGSGVGPDNLGSLAEMADTVIVGSSLKAEGDPSRPVDGRRAMAVVAAAADHGLL